MEYKNHDCQPCKFYQAVNPSYLKEGFYHAIFGENKLLPFAWKSFFEACQRISSDFPKK